MARFAQICQIFVASPSDVSSERATIFETIYGWNRANRLNRLLLDPVGWEHDVRPEFHSDAGPQPVINYRLVESSDALIGVLGARLGTPTAGFGSGTEEEIEQFVSSGRGNRTIVYFHQNPNTSGQSSEELERLANFRRFCEGRGVMGAFNSVDDLRFQISRHLNILTHDISRDWSQKLEALIWRNGAGADQFSTPNLRIRFNLGLDEKDQCQFRCIIFKPGNLIDENPIARWVPDDEFRLDSFQTIPLEDISKRLSKPYFSFKFFLRVPNNQVAKRKYYSRLVKADAIVTGEGDLDPTDDAFWRIWFLHPDGYIHPLIAAPFLANHSVSNLAML